MLRSGFELGTELDEKQVGQRDSKATSEAALTLLSLAAYFGLFLKNRGMSVSPRDLVSLHGALGPQFLLTLFLVIC